MLRKDRTCKFEYLTDWSSSSWTHMSSLASSSALPMMFVGFGSSTSKAPWSSLNFFFPTFCLKEGCHSAAAQGIDYSAKPLGESVWTNIWGVQTCQRRQSDTELPCRFSRVNFNLMLLLVLYLHIEILLYFPPHIAMTLIAYLNVKEVGIKYTWHQEELKEYSQKQINDVKEFYLPCHF